MECGGKLRLRAFEEADLDGSGSLTESEVESATRVSHAMAVLSKGLREQRLHGAPVVRLQIFAAKDGLIAAVGVLWVAVLVVLVADTVVRRGFHILQISERLRDMSVKNFACSLTFQSAQIRP